jgi:tRNA nucleotidyltransferase (CCA-adding enzyme)
VAAAGAVLDAAAALAAPLPVRFALLADALAPPAAPDDAATTAARVATAEALALHWRVDGEARDRAGLLAREAGRLATSAGWDAQALTTWLDRCDAWRRPSRVHDLALAERARSRAAAGTASAAARAADVVDRSGIRLLQALAAATAVDTGAAAREAAASGARGPEIGAAVLARRHQAVQAELTQPPRPG